ncbi:hypothetical protein K439DRAFT_1625200 [Ramaria rubella]|nr:hypothetical protein K439DRAFT_1625200 [Ramaria rubella]
MRMHLRPVQSARITFRGAFSPNPNVIKLLACLGAPAFHVKVQLQSWTTFEAFRAPVIIGDEWRVLKLFVEMFKSAARIQAPPTQVPDIDGNPFLKDGQDSFIFCDHDDNHERSLTRGRIVASNHMEVDSPLRPPPCDLSAVGCDNVNFYNFEDMEIGREDGMEPGEEYECLGDVIDIGDFDEGAFLKQSWSHPVDFIQWQEDDGENDRMAGPSIFSSTRKRPRSPSLVEQSPTAKNKPLAAGVRITSSVPSASGSRMLNLTRWGRIHKELIQGGADT